ncbi:hypothetical protein Trydic_g909 [Trypoxylus dichotomus]
MTENYSPKFQTISPKPRPCPKPKIVVNLFSRPLSANEELVLAKGLNYVISSKSIPKEGIIAEEESSIRTLPSVIADQIRYETAKCLISAKPPRSNLLREETKALKNLQSDPDCIILQADKGSAKVSLDRTQYTYVENRDPTLALERELSSLIKFSNILMEAQRRLIRRNSKPPRLYGLPKIHKEGAPQLAHPHIRYNASYICSS